MNKQELNKKKEEAMAARERQHKREAYMCYFSLFVVFGLSLPVMVIAFLIALFINAATGMLINDLGLFYVGVFLALFVIVVKALIRVLSLPPEEGEDEDIIYALFGFKENEDQPSQHKVTYNFENRKDSLTYWLYKVQRHYPQGSKTFNELEQCKTFVREIRKSDYRISPSSYQLMLDVLKSYESLYSLEIRTPKVEERLTELESAIPVIRKSLCSHYNNSVAPKLEQAEINYKAFLNKQGIDSTENPFETCPYDTKEELINVKQERQI